MNEKYKDIVTIPHDGANIYLKTKNNTIVANGYERIVFGGRGPYIEFNRDQIIYEEFFIPKNQIYRLSDARIYYIEFRSNDDANVKLYYQMRHVAYADYKLGYFYISPVDLYTLEGKACMNEEIKVNESARLFFECEDSL